MAPGPGESRAAWRPWKVPSLLPSWAGEAGAKLLSFTQLPSYPGFPEAVPGDGSGFLTGRCVLYLRAGLSLCPTPAHKDKVRAGLHPPLACLQTHT